MKVLICLFCWSIDTNITIIFCFNTYYFGLVSQQVNCHCAVCVQNQQLFSHSKCSKCLENCQEAELPYMRIVLISVRNT